MHSQIDFAFWLIVAVVGAFVALLPNTFLYLASYGGRMSYRPSPSMIAAVRICAAVMCLGAIAELLR